MIGCQRCGIGEEVGDGLRILPYLADDPDSRWNWLALCRPCFEDETAERCADLDDRLAVPKWEQAQPLTAWHRAQLGEVK